MEKEEQSEFGKGLVICLVKFAEHWWKWIEIKQHHEEMRAKCKDLFSESSGIESFFNGASDHLYEIEVPKAWEGSEIDVKVKELQSRGLKIGHGFTGEKWTERDFEECYVLCREIALLIDKQIGLEAQLGNW